MKQVIRPGHPSAGTVDLSNSEVEELADDDTGLMPVATDPAVPLDGVAERAPEGGRLRTGPGLLPEHTDSLTGVLPRTPPPPQRPTAQTASLRKGNAPPKRPFRTDEVIDELLGKTLGSYRILSLIGEGGMGRVYLSEHIELGRKVALKLLRPEYAVKRDAVLRFFQEARAVNKIQHENLVDITDLVKLDGGETFIIMELLQGEDLSDLLRSSEGPIPLHRAMQISLQVCDALEAAHSVGVVHRDLKPDNIFIVNSATKRDFVKLLDFGVAKLLTDGDDEGMDCWKTAAGAVIGTPAYMSPEQASGIPVDHRSDIYSLGAIMYEMFTGHPVFRAKSFGEFVIKHMNDDPIPPRSLSNAPTIPVALERVILRCLEKDPDNRYQSASELRDDLARATATVQTVIQAHPMPPTTRRKRRALLLLPTFGGVTLLAVIAFWLASGLTLEEVTSTLPAAKKGVTVGGADHAGPASTYVRGEARLSLLTQPSGAEVFRRQDPGRPLGRTPLHLRLQPVGEEIELVFRLSGHREAIEKVRVEDNMVISVALERADSPATAASSAQQPRSTARVPLATTPIRHGARASAPGAQRSSSEQSSRAKGTTRKQRPRGATPRDPQRQQSSSQAGSKQAPRPGGGGGGKPKLPEEKKPVKVRPGEVVDPFNL